MVLPNSTAWSEWDFPLRVGANRVSGIIPENKNGLNTSIDVVTEDIWFEGGVLSFLTNAETMLIASTSADDDGNPAGTGAHTIQIWGLDENYNPQTEIVVLNGTSNVSTLNSYLRLNRLRVLDVGSSRTNAGDISATASVSGTVQGTIGTGVGSTLKSQFTVPRGYTAYIKNLTVGTANNDQVQLDLQTRTETGAWIIRYRLNIIDRSFYQNYEIPLSVEEKSDIRVQGVKIAGAGTVSVSSNYEMYLIENDLVSNPPRTI